MIVLDTGPLVALFSKKDPFHLPASAWLRTIQEPILTTVPVLTEAFYILTPSSKGALGLCDFIMQGGLIVEFLNFESIRRMFELMNIYADHPMDLADASLIAAAELHSTLKICTIDRNDFTAYRIKKGHRHCPVHLIFVPEIT